MATPFHITEDGFESQFAINYLGHFLLSHLLLPALRAAGTKELRSRIVNVSSCVHLLGYINFDDINGKYVPNKKQLTIYWKYSYNEMLWSILRKYYYPPEAYNQSKLAQVLFTRHLQRLMDEDENAFVQTHAVHPGVVDTDLFIHSSTTYVPWFKKLLFKVNCVICPYVCTCVKRNILFHHCRTPMKVHAQFYLPHYRPNWRGAVARIWAIAYAFTWARRPKIKNYVKNSSTSHVIWSILRSLVALGSE